jgi:uncharacterized membrane protein YtjA (UPF0391 family)
MLRWSIILLVVAEVVGLVGFGGLMNDFLASIAKILFWFFFALFVFTLAFDRKRTIL